MWYSNISCNNDGSFLYYVILILNLASPDVERSLAILDKSSNFNLGIDEKEKVKTHSGFIIVGISEAGKERQNLFYPASTFFWFLRNWTCTWATTTEKNTEEHILRDAHCRLCCYPSHNTKLSYIKVPLLLLLLLYMNDSQSPHETQIHPR